MREISIFRHDAV